MSSLDSTIPAITRGRAAVWATPLTLLGIGIVLVLVMMRDTVAAMAAVWMESSSFGHGFLIAPISAALVWQARPRLAGLTPRPWLPGVPLLALASITWMLAERINLMIAAELMLVATVQILTLTLLGWRVARAIVFPLVFLLFMVPAGDTLVPYLQDVTAEFVVQGLQLVGIPVYQDGVFISIPSGQFEVAEACAGLRFLVTMVAMGTLIAHQILAGWRRLLYVALSVAVPVAANGLRAFGIVMLAHLSDYQLAAGFDHLIYGWIFLSVIMAVMLWIAWLMRAPATAVPAPAMERVTGPGEASWVVAVPLVLLAAALGPLYSTFSVPQGNRAWTELPAWPAAIDRWRHAGTAGDWRPVFVGADAERLSRYRNESAYVDLFVAHYTWQRRGAKAVSGVNSVVGSGPWNRAADAAISIDLAGGQSKVVRTQLVGPNGKTRIVWHWMIIDGRLVASPIEAKLAEVTAMLKGRPNAAAVIAIATDNANGDADRRLADFARTLPVGDLLAAPARSAGTAGGN